MGAVARASPQQHRQRRAWCRVAGAREKYRCMGQGTRAGGRGK